MLVSFLHTIPNINKIANIKSGNQLKSIYSIPGDIVSFSGNNNELPLESDMEVCKKVIRSFYGDEAIYKKHSFGTHCIPRFDVRSPKLFKNIADGVFIYDKQNKLQYIALQHHGEGSCFNIDKITIHDNQGNLIKTLSPEQAKVLRHYRGNMAVNINSVLRHGNIENSLFADDLKAMDSLFTSDEIPSVTKEDMIVYRGLNISEYNADYFISHYLNSNLIEEKSFMSTSKSKDIAHKNGNILLEIKVPKGTKYLDMHTLTSVSEYYIPEEEMLFNRNTKLIPEKFDKDTRVMTLKMLPSD